MSHQCTIQHPISKIAIFRALFLGDLLMAEPALRALRRRFPNAEITLIGLPWAASFVPHIAPCVDRFVAFAGYPGLIELPVDPDRVSRWLDEQRAYGYDLALQMHGDGNISNGLIAELRATQTLGFARPGDRRLTHSLPIREGENEVVRWLRLVAELGAPADDPRMFFHVGPQHGAAARALLDQLPGGAGPVIALHTGAKDPARRWPPDRFAVVANALIDAYDARIVLTGSAHERELTAAVQTRLQRPALDLAGHTDLGTFAALLRQIDLLLTNDTGASHLAAAMRTPSVVIFGPTRPEQFAPLDRQLHRVVDARAIIGRAVDPLTALQHLPPAPVLAACGAMLERRAPRAAHAVGAGSDS